MGDVAKGIKSFKSNMKEEKSGANTAPEIEADNEEQAEQIVRDLGVYETLDGADFNITEVELLKDE